MTKNKQPLKETIQLIVDILSYETSDTVLEHYLINSAVDWDAIVIVASKHLVLPAVYCRLKQKSLLRYLPEDLKQYLEELTQLNRDRNETLLHEVEQISKLFIANNIEHVFIKGIGLLSGNYFEDHGERMIGDIDILVASDDIDKAFKLLVNEGYSQFLPFNYEVKNYRHQPRQISKKRLGAIELHSQLLKHEYKDLINIDLFLSSKEIVNGIAVPNSEQLIWNAILAQQINDRSYYYNVLKLKGLYDVLVLGLSQKKRLIKELSNQKHSLGFLSLASIFCPSIAPLAATGKTNYKKYLFLFTMNYPAFGALMIKIKSLHSAIKERIHLFFLNKSYRAHILKNKLCKKHS